MTTTSTSPAFYIQPSSAEEQRAIHNLVLQSGIFTQSDADCVQEMFAETWKQVREDNYHWLSCWYQGALVGFTCFGREPLTEATWDLFWICVLPSVRRQGVGSALLQAALAHASALGGRLMVIYTSSAPAYLPAHRLYESQGFKRVAVVPDYYRDNEDLHIYWRRLNSSTDSVC